MRTRERPDGAMEGETAAASEPTPLVTAVGMGYGHLRAAQALADAAGTTVLRGDDAAVVGLREARHWDLTRHSYETVTRLSQAPYYGGVFRYLVDAMTEIPPPYPPRDLSSPGTSPRFLSAMIRLGLGRTHAELSRKTGRPLLTTFYAQAIAAEAHGAERVACVVTDTDIHRVWAPVDASKTRILYLAPSRRVEARLKAYGVPPERIHLTGFPLPPELLGGWELTALKRNLAARMVRLDPRRAVLGRIRDAVEAILGPLPEEEAGRPPRLTVAVGGAGAQTATALTLLQGLSEPLRTGRVRLSLVAGVRAEVAQVFRMAVSAKGLEEGPEAPVEVLHEPDFLTYYRRFNRRLAETDALWTKPSEMVFYAGLGIPLVLSQPVGRHEAYNRRWVMDRGAALQQRAPHRASGWLQEWLDEGVLAAVAWAGFRHLPQRGTYRILQTVAEDA